MRLDVSAIWEAFWIDLQPGSGEEWRAEDGSGIAWTFNPLPTGDGWLITREEGTYTQILESGPDEVVVSMKAMNRAAEALNDAMRGDA